MLIDTHAHLDFPEFADDIEGVLARATANRVTEVITIGIDLETSRKAVSIAAKYSNVRATVGIHPHGAGRLSVDDLARLKQLAATDRVVAIGEVGLDYFRDRQPRDIQRLCLRQQLDLAVELSLPVVFHIRDAYQDFLEIVAEYADQLAPSILHCYSGTWQVAARCLGFGWYLSIPGIVTFPKADVLQDVVRKAPLDRLLLETDAPFLAPVPYRGQPNEPAYLFHTAGKVAQLKQESLEQVALQTMANAHRVFRFSGDTDAEDGADDGRP